MQRERIVPAIGLLLLIAIGACGLAFSSSPPQEQPRQAESSPASSETGKDGVENAPSALDGLFAWLGGLTDGELTAYGTVVIGLFTVVLGIGTVFLVIDGRRHSRHELRAYVSISPTAIFMKGVRAGERLSIDAISKNHGQTPAFEIETEFQIDVFPRPLPDGFEFPPPRLQQGSKSTLFPGADFISWFVRDDPFTADEIAAIRKETATIWWWGVLKYRDAFGKPRTTKFIAAAGGSYFVDAVDDALAGKKEPRGWRWEYGPKHNDAT